MPPTTRLEKDQICLQKTTNESYCMSRFLSHDTAGSTGPFSDFYPCTKVHVFLGAPARTESCLRLTQERQGVVLTQLHTYISTLGIPRGMHCSQADPLFGLQTDSRHLGATRLCMSPRLSASSMRSPSSGTPRSRASTQNQILVRNWSSSASSYAGAKMTCMRRPRVVRVPHVGTSWELPHTALVHPGPTGPKFDYF